VGNLHKKNIKKIKNNLKDSNIETLKEIKNRIPYIKIHRKKYNLSKDFDRLLLKKYNSLYSSELTKLKSQVLGHGDICPQNVIINKGKLKIIDWEDLGLIDPALEILRLYDDFNFSKDNQELFLKEYLKIKKENNLKICIQSSWDLYLLEVFTWAVMHVFEISEGDMHKEFIKKQNIKEHIDYAKEIFKKCIDKGIFPKNTKFNIKKRQNA
jgi:thiamine kinase-like enzyme